jgi:uncharacterized damage-inducible protein DinB
MSIAELLVPEFDRTDSRYQMLRTMVLNHHVHHRARLGMYLRLLDEKVPQMYGLTADG